LDVKNNNSTKTKKKKHQNSAFNWDVKNLQDATANEN